jgi:hypothetical protein
VFDGRGDDTLARRPGGKQSADGRIDRLGPPGRKQDFAVTTADQCGNPCAGLVNRLSGTLAEAVNARRVAVPLGQERRHRVDDLGGRAGRGVVVEVDDVHRFLQLYGLISRAATGERRPR